MINMFYFTICFISFYSLVIYFIFKKTEVVEVLLTGIFILITGWLNLPNFFPINVKLIDDSVAFMPYKASSINGFFYALVTASLLITVTEGLKYITRNKYWNYVKRKNINKEYDAFVEDAKKLYVIGYDLDFLIDNKIQIEKFKKLGKACKILITSNLLDNKTKVIVSDLIKSNVDIRRIDNNTENEFCNLRGQIKIDSSGNINCLFVEKATNIKKTYKKINISNKFILNSLFNEFNKMHGEARHPLIKCIAIDLGGVYFNGDFHKDFVDIINSKIGTDVLSSSEDTLLLDRDLNLGLKNIVQVWQEKADKHLENEERKIILDIWKNVWNPNLDMVDLVKKLVLKGYYVYPIGNIDKENGENYKIKGFFESFNKNSFMSYEKRGGKTSVLPDRDFYENFLELEKYQPFEVLLIDDEHEDINGAINAEWNAIHFHNSKGIDVLEKEMIKLNII